jgi:hypothetical protein
MRHLLVCCALLLAFPASASALSVSDFKLKQRGTRLFFSVDICGQKDRLVYIQTFFRPEGTSRRGAGPVEMTRLPYRCTDDIGYSYRLLSDTEGLWEGRMAIEQGGVVRKTRWRSVFIR